MRLLELGDVLLRSINEERTMLTSHGAPRSSNVGVPRTTAEAMLRS